jgi:hypothetical protein
MTSLSLRYQDFEVDARARLTATATYSQAEADANRRDAFAEGRDAGAESATDTARAARAEHAAALGDALCQIEVLRQAMDGQLRECLDRLERVLRGALSASLPSAADALRRLPDTLKHLAEVSPPLAIEAWASPETEQALRSAPRALPESLRFACDPALPFGSLRLRWQGGGAVFSAEAAHEAVQALLRSALGAVGSEEPQDASAAPDPVQRTPEGNSHDQ